MRVKGPCFQLLQLGQESKDKGAIPNSLTRWKAAVTKALPADLIVRVPVTIVDNDGGQLYNPCHQLAALHSEASFEEPCFCYAAAAGHVGKAIRSFEFVALLR